METKELMVTIAQNRYEELLDMETRCNVLLDFISLKDNDITTKDIYAIFGDIETALDIKEREERVLQELREKYRNRDDEEEDENEND